MGEVTKSGFAEPVSRVLRFIREQQLVRGGQKLVVAVSGGADSVCLLHILVKLREELGVSLHVAHLNHRLRGAEADADARYVDGLARQLALSATIEQRDVTAHKDRYRLSLEEAAREVRYAFLAEVAASVGTDRVVVGHTIDDNIETILIHLVRGTGTRGLRGLQPSARWPSSGNSLTVIRPLLSVSREETVDYCRQHQLMPRLDASNLSLSPLRNRIRHQLMPLLRSYNPQVSEALLRTARIVADDLAFLEEEAGRMWDEVARLEEGIVVLDKAKFRRLPVALQRTLLRTSIEKLLGNLKDIEARHIELIIVALDKPAGKRINLPEGLVFSIEYDRYLLGLDPAALSPLPVLETEFHLEIPGETVAQGWRVEAAIIKPGKIGEAASSGDGFVACFDFDKTGDKLTVRTRRPGDRFQPLGMRQPKKLGEFMIDGKIPSAWRERVPVVCSPRHILWVAGWRIDERAKITDNTRRIIRLKFERV